MRNLKNILGGKNQEEGLSSKEIDCLITRSKAIFINPNGEAIQERQDQIMEEIRNKIPVYSEQ